MTEPENTAAATATPSDPADNRPTLANTGPQHAAEPETPVEPSVTSLTGGERAELTAQLENAERLGDSDRAARLAAQLGL